MDRLVTVEVDNIRMTNFVHLFFIIYLNSTIYGSIKTECLKNYALLLLQFLTLTKYAIDI